MGVVGMGGAGLCSAAEGVWVSFVADGDFVRQISYHFAKKTPGWWVRGSTKCEAKSHVGDVVEHCDGLGGGWPSVDHATIRVAVVIV
mgnify:CR=1 FL=1